MRPLIGRCGKVMGIRSRLALFGDSFGGFSVLTAMIRGRVPVRAGVVLNVESSTPEAMVDENTFSLRGTGHVGEVPRHGGRGRDAADPEGGVAPSPRRRDPCAGALRDRKYADRVVQSRHAATIADELRGRGQVAELLAFSREGHYHREARERRQGVSRDS